MLKIGLTGNIGSGKTTVAKIFERIGTPVFYADDEAKKLLLNSEIKTRITQLLGRNVLSSEGFLIKERISEIVFNDALKLQKLNAIIHPEVRNKYVEWCANQKSEYVIQEAAIIFESGIDKFFDKNIVVYCKESLRLERVMKRDNVNVESVKVRMNSQLADKEKNALADYLIYNEGEKLLIPQILQIHKNLINKKDF